MEEFKINQYLTLKLESFVPEGILGSFVNYVAKNLLNIENRTTMIYVNGKRFHQCKFLLMDVPVEEFSSLDEIESIDEAAEKLDNSLEDIFSGIQISPETEFWAHCSNLEAWAENNYDTRLLHRNLAFPLLKKLTEAGDPIARKVFKDEIAKRFSSGHLNTITYLINENYLEYLNKEEIEIILEDLIKNRIEFVNYKGNKIKIVFNNELDLSNSDIHDISEIKYLEKLKNLKILNLSHNKISEIKRLENLKNLKSLNLSFNQITEIKGLETLSNLKALNLNVNQIKEIKGLENLVNLTKLNLWLNPIKVLEYYLVFLSPQKVVKYCKHKREERGSDHYFYFP